jgi:hypothetical protein
MRDLYSFEVDLCVFLQIICKFYAGFMQIYSCLMQTLCKFYHHTLMPNYELFMQILCTLCACFSKFYADFYAIYAFHARFRQVYKLHSYSINAAIGRRLPEVGTLLMLNDLIWPGRRPGRGGGPTAADLA